MEPMEVIPPLTRLAPVMAMATPQPMVPTHLQMVVHVTHFVETGTSQTRDGTLQELHSIIADAGIVGNISKV